MHFSGHIYIALFRRKCIEIQQEVDKGIISPYCLNPQLFSWDISRLDNVTAMYIHNKNINHLIP